MLTSPRENSYFNSTVTNSDGTRTLDSRRTSSTAHLDLEDEVVKCIISRASAVQGFHPPELIDDIQATRYFTGQQYKSHYDWLQIPGAKTRRVSTIFSILQANCTNCGTKFHSLKMDMSTNSRKWCSFIDCEAENLVFRPIEGNAVFWRNLNDDGSGDERTLHSGMPLEDGYKVGLNIWSSEKIED